MAEKRKYEVRLTEEEKHKVEAVIRDPKVSRTIKCRAQILKLSDAGRSKRLSQRQIAKQIGVSPSTVSETVKRYANEATIDKVLTFKHNPASDDAKRKLDGRGEAKLLRLACSKPPANMSRWTVRALTEAGNRLLEKPVSKTTVHKLLRNNKVKPHRNQYYCLPPEADEDPDILDRFVRNMEAVIDVYERPYDPEYPVWSMDEKSFQFLGEIREPLPAAPGRPRRVDAEYKRNGTGVMLVYVEPLTGKTFVSTRRHRCAADWAETVAYLLLEICPEAKKVTLVVDNLNIHSINSLYKRFSKKKADALAARLELVFTPVHGSWLNIAEMQISIISRQCLTNRVPDLKTLRTIMRAWTAKRNRAAHVVKWQFSKQKARIKLRHLYPPDILAESA